MRKRILSRKGASFKLNSFALLSSGRFGNYLHQNAKVSIINGKNRAQRQPAKVRKFTVGKCKAARNERETKGVSRAEAETE